MNYVNKFFRAFYYIFTYFSHVKKIKKAFRDNIEAFNNGDIEFRISLFGKIYAPISIKSIVPHGARGDTANLAFAANGILLDYLGGRLTQNLAQSGLIQALSTPKVEKIEGTQFVYLVELYPIKYRYFVGSIIYLSKSLTILTILSLIIQYFL